MTTAELLADAAADLAAARSRRDELIRAMHEEGASLRTIAEAAGVSHQTVANIVRATDLEADEG